MSRRTALIVSEPRQPATAAEQKLQAAVVDALAARGVEIDIVPHLYDLAPGSIDLEHLQTLPGDIVLLSWLYPRAAYWVLAAHGVKGSMGPTRLGEGDDVEPPRRSGGGRTIRCIDLRQAPRPEPIVDEVARLLELGPAAAASPAAVPADFPRGQQRPRWYPVVDYDRCNNCLECLNFCLFGVYGLDDEGRLLVETPDDCRNGCPACSRICPTGAILFPQHKDAAIAGDGRAPVGQSKLDLSAMFGGPTAAELAEGERRRHGGTPANPDALDRLVDGIDDLN